MSDLPILITGGAGFIGSHLVEHVLAQGIRVRVLDNLSTGKPENLPDHPLLEKFWGDAQDSKLVTRVLAGCQSVVHLAAVASVQASIAEPVQTHQSNLVATLILAEAMRETGVRRIVFASSAAVYGDQGQDVALHERVPPAPLTPYAVDKLSSEYYLDFYRRQYGLEPVVFRLFNVYGPRQDPSSPYSGVISIFMERARQEQPIVVFGDGEQTRDFVYVKDLVAVLYQALKDPIRALGPINFGWNQSVSLNQVLACIKALRGSLPFVSYQPIRSGDIRYSQADNTKLLQYYPVTGITSLTEGLASLVS